MTARVFPLRANIDSLQRFVDGHLNFIPPEVGRFRVPAPYVYLMMLDYGKLALEAANLGWLAQREIMFCVPLEWYKVVDGRWVFSDWATVAPFIYVDDDLSMGAGPDRLRLAEDPREADTDDRRLDGEPGRAGHAGDREHDGLPEALLREKARGACLPRDRAHAADLELPHPSRSHEPVRAVGCRVESRRGGHRARQGCRRAAQGPWRHADERGLERSQLHGDDGSDGAIGVPRCGPTSARTRSTSSSSGGRSIPSSTASRR